CAGSRAGGALVDAPGAAGAAPPAPPLGALAADGAGADPAGPAGPPLQATSHSAANTTPIARRPVAGPSVLLLIAPRPAMHSPALPTARRPLARLPAARVAPLWVILIIRPAGWC